MENKTVYRKTICGACLDFQNSAEVVKNKEIVKIYNILIGTTSKNNKTLIVCKKCLEMFEKILTFRSTCLQSRIFLKKFHNKSQIDTELIIESKPSDEIEECEEENVFEDGDMDRDFQEDYHEIKIVESNSKTVCTVEPKKKSTKKIDKESKAQKMIKNVTKVLVTKEAALKEFEERRQSDKYLQALHKCEDCVLTFRLAVLLNNHMKKHDKAQGDFECWLCKTRFFDDKALKNHEAYHSRKFLCHLCDYKTSERQAVTKHYRWHAGVTFTCKKCNRTFAKTDAYRSHMRFHREGEKPVEYKCETCGKTFKFRDHYLAHTYSHTEEVFYPCNICGKSFKAKSILKGHMKIHVEKTNEFYCVECNVTFKEEKFLLTHFKNSIKHRAPETLTVSCPRCPKLFQNEQQLQTHTENTHDKIKKFSCDLCEMSFVTKRGFRAHKAKIHDGYVPPLKFTCETCAKQFRSNATLKSHIRTHTGERPLQCPHCEWNFSHSGALYTHIKLKHLKVKAKKN